MGKVRKISKRYYVRQIAACWLVSCMLFALPVQVAMAVENPAAGALPSGLIDSIGVNAPVVGGNNMGITQTAGEAIMNWTNFDIGSDAAVEFIQPSSVAAVLNRVHDGDVTGIMGSLTANGRVFVVNPAGVIFGSGASVNVAQLVASSLDIANEDFMAGNYEFLVGDGVGEVINDGTITAGEGVALLGQRVLNTGTIKTNPDGFVVMAAGDRVLLGEPGSSVIVEMSSATGDIEGVGNVINEGEITAPGGQIVLAAGDIFSAALEGIDNLAIKVDGGAGRVGQFGTLNADGVDGDGGSITLTAGEAVVLGKDSLTTANAGANGDGGEIIAYSPDTALFRDGALVEAKGGSESGNGGFFEVSGKKYVEVMGDIDLTATNGESGMFLIDPLDLWIVDDVTIDVSEDPEDTWKPTNPGSVSQLDIDDLEGYLGNADVTLSTVGTPDAEGQNGDVIFDADRYLKSGVDGYPSDNSLIVEAARNIEFTADDGIDFEGDGSIELYAYNGGVKFENSTTNPAITSNSGLDSISTVRGDIIIEAGSGGIDVGLLTTANPSTSGEQPGEIRLRTINDGIVTNDGEYDITTGRMEISGKGYGSVYINSAGDLTIENFDSGQNAVDVKINAVSEVAEDALSYVCLIAGRDLTIESAGHKGVLADSDGKTNSVASIWIGAGTNVFDEENGYPGTVTINGNLVAKASAPGDDFAKSDATIRVYGSEIYLNGTQDPQASAKGGSIKYQGDKNTAGDESGYEISVDPDAVFEYDPDEMDSDPDVRNPIYDKLVSGSRALVDIDEAKDGSCLNCTNKTIVFYINDDFPFADWFEGYTIVNIDGDILLDTAPAILDVLSNDDDGSRLDATEIKSITELTELGGTVIVSEHTEGDETYWIFEYIPPSYDVDFEWVEGEQYATFTDSFEYLAAIENYAGETVWSRETATVTITVRNEVPTLVGAEDTIHMDTSADFSLPDLVTDNDGTPGVLKPEAELGELGKVAGTYGNLTYGIVEGEIPLDAGGPIATNWGPLNTLSISDDTITYRPLWPLNGYVSPDDSPTTFGYTVSDENIKQNSETAVFELPEGEYLSVTVTNELPSGDGWLGVTPMDTPKGPTGLEAGGFADNPDGVQTEPDDVYIVGTSFDGAEYLTGDPTSGYGGELTYDEGQDKWTYTPDTEGTENLLGYTGDKNDDWYDTDNYRADEQFTVELWDGQKRYEFNGDVLIGTIVTNPGTVSVDLESGAEVSGDAYFGPVHMDDSATQSGFTSDIGTGDYEGALNSSDVAPGTYSGDDYAGTGLLGGELKFEDGQWTYTPDPRLEGYTGNDNDDWSIAPGTTYNLNTDPDEKFTVDLTTGEYDYIINEPGSDSFLKMEGGEPVVEYTPYEGTVTVELTNEAPTVTESSTILHMNDGITDQSLAADNPDTAVDPAILDVITLYDEWGGELTPGSTFTIDSGTVTIDVDNDGAYFFVFEPKDGYVGGPESFTVKVSDQEYLYSFTTTKPDDSYEEYRPDGFGNEYVIYRKKVVDEGTVSVELTNIKPSAFGDLGEAGDPVPQIGTTSPVLVIDPFDPQQKDIDDLSIIPGKYLGSEGGILVFFDDKWTYYPPDGFTGTETFTINVWDGQMDYPIEGDPEPVYGEGTVIVSTTPEVIILPPPLIRELVEYSGCPVLLQAAATELGTTAETIQISIAQALATAPNIHPCDACANLVNYAAVLSDTEGAYLEALAQVVNEFAASDAPPSEEEMASIADAIARHTDDGTHYAAAGQYLDALAQYVGLLNDNFGYPVVESVAFAADKYVSPLADKTDNVAVSTYVASRLGEIAGQ